MKKINTVTSNLPPQPQTARPPHRQRHGAPRSQNHDRAGYTGKIILKQILLQRHVRPSSKNRCRTREPEPRPLAIGPGQHFSAQADTSTPFPGRISKAGPLPRSGFDSTTRLGPASPKLVNLAEKEWASSSPDAHSESVARPSAMPCHGAKVHCPVTPYAPVCPAFVGRAYRWALIFIFFRAKPPFWQPSF